MIKKWFIVCLGIVFLLQACTLNDHKDTQKEVGLVGDQLLQAAEQGDREAVYKLIADENIDLNIQDAIGRTPMMIATYNNDVTTVKALIDAGADVNIQDELDNNPFLYAGAEGNIDILKLANQAGADPTLTNRYGGTALIPASEHGYVDIVNYLLEQTTMDVNHVNNLGWTALMEAIILGDGGEKQQEMVKVLLAHGADMNMADLDGVKPLQHAQEKGLKEIANILALESFNQLTEADKTQLKMDFFQAATRGEATQVTEILNKGIDINVADEQGRTAAMIATYGNYPHVVKVLIEQGADINKRDHMENNPFLYAGAEGYIEILRLTIEAGADPTIFNRFGGTALIPAAEHGYVENVQEILEHTNVDVNHMNKPGWTALLEAIVYGDGGPKYQETIHILIEHGANVHLADAKGISPLQHAQSRGFQEISNILMQAGENNR